MHGVRVVAAGVVGIGIGTVAALAAAPAQAAPNPCAVLPLQLCLFVPVYPDLDHDIDLTQNPDGTPVDLTDPHDVQVAPAPVDGAAPPDGN